LGPAFTWVLALRYLRARWINVLGMLGVTVAVFAVIAVRGVFSGFIDDIRSEVRRTSPDLLLTGLPRESSFAALQQALVDDDVVALAPRLRHYGVFYARAAAEATSSAELEFSNVDNSFVQLLGIDPELEAKTSQYLDWLRRGRRTTFGARPDPPPLELGPMLQVPPELEYRVRQRLGLPVPARRADYRRSLWPGLLLGRYRVVRHQHDLALGEPVDVVSVDFPRGRRADDGQGDGKDGGKVLALQATFAFAGVFETGARLFDDTTAIVPIEALRTMLGHDALDPQSIDLCTDVAIRARDGMTAAALQALAGRLLPRALAALPRPLPKNAHPEVLTWEQQNVVFLDAVDTERAMMTAVLFAVMLIASFLIYATLHMMVTQRIKDIGIVSALGGSPHGIGRIFVQCGIVIGTVGACGGIALAIALLVNLNVLNDWCQDHLGVALFPPSLFALRAIPYRIEVDWVVGFALSALVLTVLVAWLPARKAARMHPVEALSYE
jgi:lipoprotein-releasing system permease protein